MKNILKILKILKKIPTDGSETQKIKLNIL
jgi:hypothetical protein